MRSSEKLSFPPLPETKVLSLYLAYIKSSRLLMPAQACVDKD
jgi:hypothetical protein